MGELFSASSETAAITMPGVQNPHWSPCSARNARCTGCIASGPSPLARPSTVCTARPSACAARSVHDFTDCPSSRTVQAPQELVSQPTLVAVRLACSRRKCTSSVRSGTSASTWLPLTVTVTFTGSPSRR